MAEVRRYLLLERRASRVKISAAVRDRMIEEGLRSAPLEAVGVLFDADDFVVLRNAAESAVRFAICAEEFENLVRGRDPVAFFHTHPTDLPAPSTLDFEGAKDWPHVNHLILALNPKPVLRCWRLFDGQAMPEPIEVY